MTDSTATPTVEESSLLWGVSERRSRKSGYSNIFSGVNIQQLQRLFQTAGDRDAEHRAKLVWRGGEEEDDVQPTDGAKGTEGTEEEAGLAQALVGLRICARTKAGLRAEGPTREQRWYRASPHVQSKDSVSGYSVLEEDLTTVTHDLALLNGEKFSGNPNKSSSWRLGVARHESVRDSERYLHRILH